MKTEWMLAIRLSPAGAMVDIAQVIAMVASLAIYLSWLFPSERKFLQYIGCILLMAWGFLPYSIVTDPEYHWSTLMLLRMMCLGALPGVIILGVGGGLHLLFRRR